MPDAAGPTVALQARSVRVRGIVQGVGFRPFVYRLAHAHQLNGWVLNHEEGVEIHLEGALPALDCFVRELVEQAPPAARIVSVEVDSSEPAGLGDFQIRPSERRARPVTRISPDLPICARCLAELFDPRDPRYRYPYINCTDCGPRYSIILGLPYDRPLTTMAAWPMDSYCAAQYDDPLNRRFHAQPVACPQCGPQYSLASDGETLAHGQAAIAAAARLLTSGGIVAVKGIGGYHLACDAGNADAVALLRERKFRKEKPFAVMPGDLETARALAHLDSDAVGLLESAARPIVLVPSRVELEGVAPDSNELGVLLPYAPIHHLLFAAGAPDVLVMTSANRSSEPIAFRDAEAVESLAGIADAFLIGERPIARRVDDSIARAGAFGPAILRRARGYAPGAVATVPAGRPILAVGADLKNSIALAVEGQVIVSQHIGDLEHLPALTAFRETIHDLLRMYDLEPSGVVVAHDAHPQYFSTQEALALEGERCVAVQHHRAHIASVLAEREAFDTPVLGVSFDGTGYGDDGSIWGCEFFAGSLSGGLRRVAHLRPAALAGGDAAARHPVQAAAGFLAQIDNLPDLAAPPFHFPDRYRVAARLLQSGFRTFATTSMGRLFDAAAALTGFTRAITFEAQAAMWLENQARGAGPVAPYPFPFEDGVLDFRPLLAALCRDRRAGRDPAQVAAAFHAGVAEGAAASIRTLCRVHGLETVALSGGVFQNERLLVELRGRLSGGPAVWVNRAVPANDGGISLGQVALVAAATIQAAAPAA
ncbi:MAG TPA: carbamoyltransferase HypF [Bryobacteraceae bacterium]|nr:carbamoyltransferase HypF [Bryobacteraceae bacterium]